MIERVCAEQNGPIRTPSLAVRVPEFLGWCGLPVFFLAPARLVRFRPDLVAVGALVLATADPIFRI